MPDHILNLSFMSVDRYSAEGVIKITPFSLLHDDCSLIGSGMFYSRV